LKAAKKKNIKNHGEVVSVHIYPIERDCAPAILYPEHLITPCETPEERHLEKGKGSLKRDEEKGGNGLMLKQREMIELGGGT